jgi:lysozyme
MRTGPRGRALIRHFEGHTPYAYNDPVGFCTAGPGILLHRSKCTRADYEKYGSRERPKISERRYDEMLRTALASREDAVEDLVKVRLAQHEFDGLVSLVYNIGAGNFESSTVLRELNRGHRYRAGLAFLMWNRAGGRVLLGLSRRRRAERRLFRKGTWK